MSVEGIPSIFSTDVPLAPRRHQRGLSLTATSTPSTPVALPGVKGDIMSFCVRGSNDVQFIFSTSLSIQCDSTSEVVFGRTKELFETPTDYQGQDPCLISVVAPDGDTLVVINCHKRGT